MSLVELRPLPRETWHGKKGEDSFKPDGKSQVLVDPATNRLATGLTEEEAVTYGKLLGLDLSDKFDPEIPHPYWSTNPAIIKLKNSTQVFDTSKPMDFVKVANLKASKLVANSMKEWEQGFFPYATHVIDDEKTEIERKATKIDRKNIAMNLIAKMSAEDKCNLIQIISGKSLRGKSLSFLTVEMDEILTNSTEELIKYAQLDKETTFLHALVLEAVYRNILTKEGTGIYFLGDIIGHTMEEVVAYFKDPNNHKLKLTILGKMGAGRPEPVKEEIKAPIQELVAEATLVEEKPKAKTI